MNNKEKLNFDLDFLGKDENDTNISQEKENVIENLQEGTTEISQDINLGNNLIINETETFKDEPNEEINIAKNNDFFEKEIQTDNIASINESTSDHTQEKTIPNNKAEDETNVTQSSKNIKNEEVQQNNSKQVPDKIPRAFLIFVIVIVSVIFTGAIYSYINTKNEEIRQQEITQLELLAYDYKKQASPFYIDAIRELAKLSKEDINIIEKRLQEKFENEKSITIKKIVEDMLEIGKINEVDAEKCLSQFYNNNFDKFTLDIEKEIIKRYDDIIDLLISYWKTDTKLFEKEKDKYLKTLFQGNEKELNQALDKNLGYKQFTLKPVTINTSRVLHNYTGLSATAPFKVSAPMGNDYYIKLEDAISGKPSVILYVKGGATKEFNVPLGRYKIKYASGDIWYGEEDLFGHKTNYTKSDEIFSFRINGEYIEGHSITLYKVANGNLRTTDISAKDF